MSSSQIALGVSSCLLGEAVRYDGGHRHDHYITDTLGKYFRFVPVCPEVGSGMPIPREPMRLEGDPEQPRLMTIKSRVDLTEQMESFCWEKVEALEREELCGFIFKKDSPSSGLYRVKVYTSVPAKDGISKSHVTVHKGRGLFADAVCKRFPFLPVEEDSRLHDPIHRENFIERVFTYSRWKAFLRAEPTLGDLVEFHAAHKLLIMAHSPTLYRELGALVGKGAELPEGELFLRYGELLMMAMSMCATVKKHTDVLMHIMGYFKSVLTREEKEELLDLIRKYHNHLVPHIVPVTMLRHYCLKFENTYLSRQLYLSPVPEELALRNHA
ncbi:YbgA family protein [Geomesophilobacter sediminis]|uniref:DUF523 and DUF1722 domain-containing protein n=1 Tax=Geomesophilobacter sediminis TaxID=2798584 RepID=A0A8J7S797_9BACT|nr:DUF523 and DUF1722 domain-containing protein [Geomesophilobacter sediminis]MBJ6726911.1 DUF523 and DUF1722 domain-containing protein [Geomesophilobacter sediminis]